MSSDINWAVIFISSVFISAIHTSPSILSGAHGNVHSHHAHHHPHHHVHDTPVHPLPRELALEHGLDAHAVPEHPLPLIDPLHPAHPLDPLHDLPHPIPLGTSSLNHHHGSPEHPLPLIDHEIHGHPVNHFREHPGHPVPLEHGIDHHSPHPEHPLPLVDHEHPAHPVHPPHDHPPHPAPLEHGIDPHHPIPTHPLPLIDHDHPIHPVHPVHDHPIHPTPLIHGNDPYHHHPKHHAPLAHDPYHHHPKHHDPYHKHGHHPYVAPYVSMHNISNTQSSSLLNEISKIAIIEKSKPTKFVEHINMKDPYLSSNIYDSPNSLKDIVPQINGNHNNFDLDIENIGKKYKVLDPYHKSLFREISHISDIENPARIKSMPLIVSGPHGFENYDTEQNTIDTPLGNLLTDPPDNVLFGTHKDLPSLSIVHNNDNQLVDVFPPIGNDHEFHHDPLYINLPYEEYVRMFKVKLLLSTVF